MKNNISLLLLSFLLFSSCDTTEKVPQEKPASEQEETVQESKITSDQTGTPSQNQPALKEIEAVVTILEVEDAGYPMHYATVLFAETGEKTALNFNAEHVGFDLNDAINLIGKSATIQYTQSLEANLMDIRLVGETLLEDNAEISIEGLKQVHGILSGADAPTTSDLPGKITVTPLYGIPVAFDYFVTEKMAEANGKMVIGYYDMHETNMLINLKASENAN